MFDLKLVFCRIRNLQLTALNEENKLLMITYVPYIFILLITIKYQVCMIITIREYILLKYEW